MKTVRARYIVILSIVAIVSVVMYVAEFTRGPGSGGVGPFDHLIYQPGTAAALSPDMPAKDADALFLSMQMFPSKLTPDDAQRVVDYMLQLVDRRGADWSNRANDMNVICSRAQSTFEPVLRLRFTEVSNATDDELRVIKMRVLLGALVKTDERYLSELSKFEKRPGDYRLEK